MTKNEEKTLNPQPEPEKSTDLILKLLERRRAEAEESPWTTQ